MSRTNALPSLLCLAALLLCASVAAASSPALHFVNTTLSWETDQRDSLAAGFDTRQLPMLMAAMVADPPTDVAPDRLYRALTRWHYFAGREFDPRQTGLWTTTAPVPDADSKTTSNMTLASGASLELIELSALARLASMRGHVFDPLVWWHDHLELRERLTNALYDPVDGAYANLDSLGRRVADPDLSGLIPIALGARHGGEATRLAAWRLWTGAPLRVEQGQMETGLAVRGSAEAFDSWSTDHGLRLISSEAMGALSLLALHELDEPTLAVYIRDALAARGISDRDSIRVRLGEWAVSVAAEDLSVQPLERSAAALKFIAALGAFSPAQADSLVGLASLEADASDDEIAAAISTLTNVLVELRGITVRDVSGGWAQRRGGADDFDPDDRASFDFQWTDLHLWFDRALDLMTADILDWHLRPDYRSSWTATLDPPVVGHGDSPVLRVHSRTKLSGDDSAPETVTLMWSNGSQLLPPVSFELRQDHAQDFVSEVPPLPRRNGLWQLIVEGLPQRPRIAAAVSVVDPVVVSVLPVERRDTTVDWAIQLRSQVRTPVAGRVNLDAPLSWSSSPATSLQYSLEPGAVTEVKFAITPDRDVAPGTYPLRWTVWSDARLIGDFDGVVDRPFSWLRVGPLPITENDSPIDSRYAFDQQIDLASRVQGVERTVAWTKLPTDRVGADGFVSVSADGEPAGIHYAFTAFVTQSREALVDFECEGPAQVFINGRRVISLDRWGGRKEADVEFGGGTNFIVVKLVGDQREGARFRFRTRDIDGQPLRGLGNQLEHLVENYAYLARARHSASGGEERHTLRLVPIHFVNPTADNVSVVGGFNGWSPSATPMSRLPDGSWQVKIRLRPGRFEYKFAIDGAEWIPDPNNPDAVDDGFGGRNSVLVVD